jgi:dGTP triphosphohydrolase
MSNIEESVKAMIPQITREIADNIKAQVSSNLERSVSGAIHEAVTAHLKEVIMPAVKAELVEQEAAIKAAVLAASKGVAEMLATTLVAHMEKRLTGYEGDKLVRDVFGPLFRTY